MIFHSKFSAIKNDEKKEIRKIEKQAFPVFLFLFLFLHRKFGIFFFFFFLRSTQCLSDLISMHEFWILNVSFLFIFILHVLVFKGPLENFTIFFSHFFCFSLFQKKKNFTHFIFWFYFSLIFKQKFLKEYKFYSTIFIPPVVFKKFCTVWITYILYWKMEIYFYFPSPLLYICDSSFLRWIYIYNWTKLFLYVNSYE